MCDYVHGFFGLSYAQYLTVPRSVLQSMPEEWQKRFVGCMNELEETIDWEPSQGTYRVQLFETDEGARLSEDEDAVYWVREIDDPLADYERGRRRIPYRTPM